MDDSSDITIDSLLSKAVSGNEQAVNFVVGDPRTVDLLFEVTNWAVNKYHQDRGDVWGHVAAVLMTKIPSLRNPNHKCLRAFCYSTARNYCCTKLQREKRAREHERKVMAESTSRRMRTRKGGITAIEISQVLTPEQELLKKERDAQIREAELKAIERFPGDKAILHLWKQGHSVNETAEEIDKSPQTVYRRLKRIQKAIVAEAGIKPSGKDNSIW